MLLNGSIEVGVKALTSLPDAKAQLKNDNEIITNFR